MDKVKLIAKLEEIKELSDNDNGVMSYNICMKADDILTELKSECEPYCSNYAMGKQAKQCDSQCSRCKMLESDEGGTFTRINDITTEMSANFNRFMCKDYIRSQRQTPCENQCFICRNEQNSI